MKRSIGVLTVLVIAALAIIMAPVLQGCQTQTPMLDGAGNVVRDAEGNPILISTPDVAGTTAAIQLALTSFEQGMTIWDRYHPQACGCGQALYVDLANPRDGKGPERDDGHVWQNTWGEIRDERDYFETLTLHPSILRSKDHGGCGWHGWVRNGEIVNA